MVVNAFVGAMVGMERSILPAIAEQEFQLAARTAVLSFIVVFGIAKALTNDGAGRLSDHFGRKHVLVAGWLVAVPVPFLLMWAPSWRFDGHGECFIEIGGGKAGFGGGDFYAEPKPAVTLRQPGWRWHLGKVWVEKSWLYTKL